MEVQPVNIKFGHSLVTVAGNNRRILRPVLADITNQQGETLPRQLTTIDIETFTNARLTQQGNQIK